MVGTVRTSSVTRTRLNKLGVLPIFGIAIRRFNTILREEEEEVENIIRSDCMFIDNLQDCNGPGREEGCEGK